MKKIIGIIGLATFVWCIAYMQNHDVPRRAWAGITCSLPIVLQNGTTADANQVMSDFNALAACFLNVATVSSVTCGPGLDGGVITGIGTCQLSAARRTNPTTQTFVGAGTFTYTTPVNVIWLEVWLIGGGGGGGGSGTGSGPGGNGGDSCWGASGCTTPTFRAGGGVGGQAGGATGQGNAGTGGVVGGTSCFVGLPGNDGQQGNSSGGPSPGGFGGAGPYGGTHTGPAGSNTPSNAGTGSGGMGGGSSSNNPGPGGGAGAYCYGIIGSVAASYSITVGGGGTAGAIGGQQAGQIGANGSIYVLEHYN